MFPELAEKARIEVLNKNSNPPRYAPELSDDALDDYDDTICFNPNFAEVYANRAEAKISLGSIDEAKLDFKIALELAEQQGKTDFKSYIKKRLQEFNN